MIDLVNIDKIADGLGLGLDEKIKRPVQILMSLEFKTTQSCEGHHDWGLPYPWIEFEGKRKQIANLLSEYKQEHSSNLQLERVELVESLFDKRFRLMGGNQVKYDADGQAHKRAWTKNWQRPKEEMDELIEGLIKDQNDMLSFCEWLLNRA